MIYIYIYNNKSVYIACLHIYINIYILNSDLERWHTYHTYIYILI